MKQTNLITAVALALASTSALATNGDELIGLGTQARALGGTGVAAYYGSENALVNPALLGKSKGTEVTFGATAFMPKVKARSDFMTMPAVASKTSDNDLNMIPEVSISHRVNDNWTLGIGMNGSAGMGVDYRGNAGLAEAYSRLQLMKVAPTVAYNGDGFGLGLAGVLQYGALDLNYRMPAPPAGPGNVGNGTSDDFGAGFNLGGYFDLNDRVTLGLGYQSEISMRYKDQITDAANGLGVGPTGMGTITSNTLTQPAQIKAGLAYTADNWLLTADYKKIQWGSAAGYKTFNWKDQDVFGLGAKYMNDNYWLGIGYNYAKDPIKKRSDTSYPNQAINLFNNLFFPGIVEQHFTLGGGVGIGKNTTLEGAFVYTPTKSKTVNTGILTGAMAGMPMPVNATTEKTTHSQTAVSVSLRMNF